MMALSITSDGRVFNEDGYELFELTLYQQDEVIKLLYPGDGKLRTTAEFSKLQTSWTGSHAYDVDKFATLSKPFLNDDDCEMPNRMEKWGGIRLRTLYCHGFHFEAAANDLKIPYNTLHKWFRRWRAQKLALGLTPEALFSDPKKIIHP